MLSQTKSIFLEALDGVAQTLLRLLPGLLALLLILAAAAPLALLVRWVVRRLCLKLSLDRRMREWGMAEPERAGRRPPSARIAGAAGWMVMLLGFLLGLTAFEASTASALALRLLDYLPHALVGVIILVVGLAVSRAVERSVLIGAVNMGLQSAHMLGLGARWLVAVLSLAMALEKLELGGTILVVSFSILFGGIVLALSLAIGLGAREVVARSLEKRMTQPGQPSPSQPPEPAEGAAPPGDVHHL